MSAYKKHEPRFSCQGGLDLVELNRVLRAVGFAKFHGKLREATLPRPPRVPKKDQPVSTQQRGAPEPGSAKADLQAAVKKHQASSREHLGSAVQQSVEQISGMPPLPPTSHLQSDSAALQKLLNATQRRNAVDCVGDPVKIASAAKLSVAESSAERLNRLLLERRPRREGTDDSFRVDLNNDVYVDPLAAHRCYRILTYKDTVEGRIVFDILSGTEYFCRSGPQKRRITPSAVVFRTRQEAMGEKFPPESGRLAMPRILVRFDCWGVCRKRLGGGGNSAVYEYAKYLGIVQFLDSPATISKKQCEHPTGPNPYPLADKPLPLRRKIDRRIMVDKSFDVNPWKKGISAR